MLRNFAVMMSLLAVCIGFVPMDADAGKRFGGRSSSGMQRSLPPQQAPSARPDRDTAQNAGAPTRSTPRWLAPLIGFGLGALFMSMFGGSAFAGLLGNILMFALIFMAIRYLMRLWQAKQQPAAQHAGGFQREALHGRGYEVQMPGGAGASSARIPADFDAAAFLRQAKVSFLRMQAANDAGDLNDIRDYTTPELYAEIAMQIQERGAAKQRVEVVKLEADLLEVLTEGDRQIASVRFSGLIREDEGGPAQDFQEAWHVVKDANDAKASWMIAGIQQI
jgi:predicted lipid-binding transport protein (Tim44 family)